MESPEPPANLPQGTPPARRRTLIADRAEERIVLADRFDADRSHQPGDTLNADSGSDDVVPAVKLGDRAGP